MKVRPFQKEWAHEKGCGQYRHHLPSCLGDKQQRYGEGCCGRGSIRGSRCTTVDSVVSADRSGVFGGSVTTRKQFPIPSHTLLPFFGMAFVGVPAE